MRNIIRTLINEGVETEDIVAIAKYLMEEYEVIDEGQNLEGVVHRMGKHLPTKKFEQLAKKARKMEGTNDISFPDGNTIGYPYVVTGDMDKNLNKHELGMAKKHRETPFPVYIKQSEKADKYRAKIYKETHNGEEPGPFVDISDEVNKRRTQRKIEKSKKRG